MTRGENREQKAENRLRRAQIGPNADAANALAIALRRGEWERAGLLLLLAMADVARAAPGGTVDDLLALLSDEEVRDEHRR